MTRKHKQMGFSAKQQLCTCIRLFCTFLFRLCTTNLRKCLILCFMEDVNKRRRILLSLSKLECGLQEINSREYICLHSKFSERLKKTRIHLKRGVFAAVAHPCEPVTGPGVPWGFSSDKCCKSSPLRKIFVILTFRHGEKLACVAAIHVD